MVAARVWSDRQTKLFAKELRRVIKYSPDAGTFIWRVPHGGHHGQIPAGTEAGSIWAAGYRMICIGNVRYKAARLAWLYMTARWPDGDVDHINRNRSDDRWSNLRDATRQQSQANKIMKNATGFKGVARYRSNGHWYYKAYIEVDGRSMHLGNFKTAKEAHAVYAAAAKKYFGKFALTEGEYMSYK